MTNKQTASKPVTIHILGAEYHVSSPPEQVEALEAAARELDRRMREIKASGNMVGTERIAVMAALNVTYELHQKSGFSSEQAKQTNDRINQLTHDIERVLASGAQLELT